MKSISRIIALAVTHCLCVLHANGQVAGNLIRPQNDGNHALENKGRNTPEQEIAPDKNMYKCGITTDYIKSVRESSKPNAHARPGAATYSVASLLPSTAMYTCGLIDVYYEDINSATGAGFDDPVRGSIRRNTLCAVLTYLQNTFKFSRVSATNHLRLHINQSYAAGTSLPAPSGTNLYASAMFHSDPSVTSGIIGGFFNDYVNSGTDPAAATDYHAEVTVNFDQVYPASSAPVAVQWNDDYTTTSACKIDLFSALLHEMGHAMGWISYVRASPVTPGASCSCVYFTSSATGPLVGIAGPNLFTKLDQSMYGGGAVYPSVSGMQPLITTSGGSYIVNPLAPNPDKNYWINNSAAPDNHPVFAGSIYLADSNSYFSHLDDQLLSYTYRQRISPGDRQEYVMGPFGIEGALRREYTKGELQTFVNGLGYTLDSTFGATHPEVLGNYVPYSTVMAALGLTTSNYADFTETMAHDASMTNNTGSSHTVTISGLQSSGDLTDADGSADLAAMTIDPASIINIRGCGDGNNHNQLTLSSDHKSIVYQPRTGFYGRAQFGFNVTDGKEKGSFRVYTIDVAMGTNVPYTPGSNMICNADMEQGSEIKVRGTTGGEAIPNTYMADNLLHEGKWQGICFSDSHPYAYKSDHYVTAYRFSGSVVGNSAIYCDGVAETHQIGSRDLTFPYTAGVTSSVDNPNPPSGGDRYQRFWNTSSSYYYLKANATQCNYYTLEFDMYRPNDNYNNYICPGCSTANLTVSFADHIGAFNFTAPSHGFAMTTGSWVHQSYSFWYCGETASNILYIGNPEQRDFLIDNLSLTQVLTPPAMAVTATAAPASECRMSLSASITNPGCTPSNYSWTGPDLSCTDCENPIADPETTTVYYLTVTDNCGTRSASTSVTVIPQTVVIGPTTLCIGATATLDNVTPGGTWTSSAPSVATINASTGLITGVAAGTSTITYAISSECYAVSVVTVVESPGTIHICEQFPVATCDDVISYCDGFKLKVAGVAAGTSFSWSPSVSATASLEGSDELFTFTAPPAAGITTYELTATCGSTTTADITIVTAESGACYPCGHFTPCSATCEGCDTVAYFRTIIASALTGANIVGSIQNYFIAADAALSVSPTAGSVFYMGTGVELTVNATDAVTLGGCHFFSSPECTWKGITVAISSTDAGKLTVNNNTLIEHASEAGDPVGRGAVTIIPNSSGAMPASGGNILFSNGAIYNQNRVGIFIQKADDYTADVPYTVQGSVFTNRDFCGYSVESETPAPNDFYPFKWPAADNLRTVDPTYYSDNNPNYNVDHFTQLTSDAATAGGWGIYLDQVGKTDISTTDTYHNLFIGDGNSADSANLFDGMINGVSLTNSNVVFYNNVFRRTYYRTYGAGVEATANSHRTVQLLNGATTSIHNTFYNCYYGVKCTDCYDFESQFTEMRATNRYLTPGDSDIVGSYGFYMMQSALNRELIQNSNINNVQYGIYTYLGSGDCNEPVITFRDNTLTGLASAAGFEWGLNGIDVFDANIYCPVGPDYYNVVTGALNIQANNITGYKNGIHVSALPWDPATPYFSMLGVLIDSNTIVMRYNYSNDYVDSDFYGINVSYLYHLEEINYNTVFGDTLGGVMFSVPTSYIDLAGPVEQIRGCRGINATDSRNSPNGWTYPIYDDKAFIMCNYVHDLGIGFEFNGQGGALKWANNVMMRNNYGLVLSQLAHIGSQGIFCEPSDNVWAEDGLGITTGWPGWRDYHSGVYETFTVGVTPYTTFGSSELFVRPDPYPGYPPYYMPDNNGTAGTSSGAYANPAGLFDVTIYCTSPGTIPEAAPCLPLGIAGPGDEHGHEKAILGLVEHKLPEQKYTLLPNPSDGNITIRQSMVTDAGAHVKVMNSVGTTVYSGTLKFANGQSQLAVDDVAQGIYLLELEEGNGAKTTFKVTILK